MTKRLIFIASILTITVLVIGAALVMGSNTAKATTAEGSCRHVSDFDRELICDEITGLCKWVTVHTSEVVCGSQTL